jgi:hypothetical protein
MLFKAGMGPWEWYSMVKGVRGNIGLMALAPMLWCLSIWAFAARTMHDDGFYYHRSRSNALGS